MPLASRFSPIFAFVLFASAAACSADDGSSPTSQNENPDGGETTTPPNDGSSALVATIAGCPAQGALVETTEWVSCLAGKNLAGAELFGNQSCELRIGADGSLAYVRGDVVALATPARASWKGGAGSYQNSGSGDRLVFLASVAPDLEHVEGQPRVIRVNVAIFGLASPESKVEVEYLDAALARQIYNCKLTR